MSEVPAGSVFNDDRFDWLPVGKARVVFTHAGSAVSEVLVWKE